MRSKKFDRRGFLTGGAALVGGLAVGGTRRAIVHAQDHAHAEIEASQVTAGGQEPGPKMIHDSEVRALGETSRFERKIVRRGSGSMGLTPLQDLQGIITPSELHFYENHENGNTPDIDPQQHRLLIHGMVDRPVELTMDEIKRLPSVSRICVLECGGNTNNMFDKKAKTAQDIHGKASCSEWTGVLLSLLLKEVGVQRGAEWLIGVAADPSSHAHTFPMAKAMDDVIVAYAQNGIPLRIENGYPLRLVMPGWHARLHVKWLNRIKVVDQPYALHQEVASYMEHGPAGMFTYEFAGAKAFGYHHETPCKSIITFPSGGQQLPKPGIYEISGLAWSGAGAIRKVEVSVDSGKTWKVAQLQEPVLPRAFTRFRLPWKWEGSEVIVQSRSTDETGAVQASPEQVGWTNSPKSPAQVSVWGSDTSEACRSFLGDDLCSRLPRRIGMSIIQSWKVNRNGTVENPMPQMAESHGVALPSRGAAEHDEH
jgi:sulfane dehydrogenase subunit SoxC